MIKKKILFITPTLNRTGSEMVLWYLLNNIDREKFEPYVFSLEQGTLFKELPVTISKSVAYKRSGIWWKRLFRGLLKLAAIDPVAYQLEKIQHNFKADLWYTNTLMIPQASIAAKKVGVKIATHFHEILYAYSFIKAQEFKNIAEKSDYLVACSPKAYQELRRISDKKILLQRSFFDINSIQIDHNEALLLRKKFAIPDNNFVWAISGTMHYMKGAEYIIQLLDIYKDRNITFVWLGATGDDGLTYYIQEVARRSKGKLVLTGSLAENYYNHLSFCDGFLMVSKEESFSLVLLDAAYCKLPIVSFDTGIAEEFIKEGMGYCISDWSIGSLVKAMNKVHNGDYVKDAEISCKAVLPYTVEAQIPQFESLLETLIGNSNED